MKLVTNLFFVVCALACIGISGYLLINKGSKEEGWGWFLLASILFGCGIKFNPSPED